MKSGLTVSRRFRVQRKRHGRKALRVGHQNRTPPAERIPRIARLMALAIHFDQLLRDGVVADQAELARLGHVSRTRLTQIMNLLNLAPDIQERILFIPPFCSGRNLITERTLRPIAGRLNWRYQRSIWQTTTSRAGVPDGTK